MKSTVNVVAEHGFHGASMAAIASRAGVAAGTIYIHFENRDHLMIETYEKLQQRCLAAVMTDYPSQGSYQQCFFHLAHRLIHHFMQFPAEFLFVDQFLSSPYRKSAIPNDQSVAWLNSIVQFFREGVNFQYFKEMPATMLFAMACGPAVQVLRANMTGVLYLNDDRIADTVVACWETVSLHGGSG